ncbi:DUF2318 domain-containing protein [Anoxybacterium hadale]|uniref:DUF2318 domain-containing protein n=1 Tax=Anoxybacterium hadale TaxID=3408580 RepID=A0ACD1A745_9FIRM|nr:DUF2318 domain-containing protein [Clostridiales bacterium]
MKKSTLIILVVAVFAAAAAAFVLLAPKDGDLALSGNPTKEAVLNENGDLVISGSDITETAAFYTYNELDKKMEIIAVKASDGTIRTAFNTCQVCYSSGKGYYIQEGEFLVCQNCGNRFGMDEVELTKGGCNPVPITDEYKTEADGVITIPKDFLEEAQVIFENWKI